LFGAQIGGFFDTRSLGFATGLPTFTLGSRGRFGLATARIGRSPAGLVSGTVDAFTQGLLPGQSKGNHSGTHDENKSKRFQKFRVFHKLRSPG